MLQRPKDTWLYLYYDADGLATSASSTNAWEPNFKGVWHLEEDMPGIGTEALYTDATAARNAGTDKHSRGSLQRTDRLGRELRQCGRTDHGPRAGQSHGRLPMAASTPVPAPSRSRRWIDYADGKRRIPQHRCLRRWSRQHFRLLVYLSPRSRSTQFTSAWPSATAPRAQYFTARPIPVMLVNQGWRHVTAVVERDAVEDKVTFYLDGAPIGSEISADIVDGIGRLGEAICNWRDRASPAIGPGTEPSMKCAGVLSGA